MNCYETVARFLESLSGGLATDITTPHSVNVEKRMGVNEAPFLVAKITYDVDYKMLLIIIENFKRWFMGRTVWSHEPPQYNPSPAEHSFTWKDGTKIFIRTKGEGSNE